MNAADLPDETLFEGVLKCRTPAERAAYLDRFCAGQPELRRKLETLLEAHDQAGEFMEPAAAARPTIKLDRAPEETPGTMIGRYKLLQKIGEGGMGIVYMAEQTEPVVRRVALKIIKLGMDTRQVVARFEAERQALAMMDHQNIAKVLDAGATETGRPFFVMELVHGVPITEYCDRNKLSARERIELFIPICQAIQHAHQKGIIHRDIKPSNVMVTLHDGVPVPKVIDFGVAKATNQRLTEKTLFTNYAQMIGTPAYMSPEQAELSGLDIDTRSDVYSLGVLLYELLTGTTPFPANELLSKGYAEMQRMIVEQEPLKPSTRMSTMQNEERTVVAKNRSMEANALRRVLQGDIDWIVMKCLEKDRTRRYETSNGLAADLLRHLNNELITARPPTTGYLLAKLIRRNKGPFVAASAVAASLVIGITISLWNAHRARQAEHEAKHQAQIARMAEQEQKVLRTKSDAARQQAEAENYAAEMASASYAVGVGGGLGGVREALERWRHHEADFRGWEWYYLNGLCHPEMLTIQAYDRWLKTVVWSPDGKFLASAGDEPAVKIWSAVDGHPIKELVGHTARVNDVAWSPNGSRLASVSTDKTLKVWDLELGAALFTGLGHTGPVLRVRWSPDGLTLATSSRDRTVRLWDARTGTEVRSLRSPLHIYAISWSADGKRLGASGAQGLAAVWDVADGQPVPVNPIRESNLTIEWSPDGKWFASGGFGSLRIWDADVNRCLRTNFHDGAIEALAWSRDGSRLASSSRGDGEIKIWASPDWGQVLSLRGHRGTVESMSWSPDGRQLVSSGADGAFKVWALHTNDPMRTILKARDQVNSLSWAPDGGHLAYGGGYGSVWIWNLMDGAEPVQVTKHSAIVWRVAWSPTGKRLASGCHDGVLKLWDQAAGREIWSVQSHPIELRGLAWSPDGNSLASTSGQDARVVIRESATGELKASFDLAIPGALALAWSSDGSKLATGRNEITVLDYPSGRTKWKARGHAELLRDLAWSPDGRRLASASDDTTIQIHDGETGREIHTLLGHVSQVYCVAWSPDGTRLVSAGWDGMIKVWNSVTGRLLCSLTGSGNRQSDVWNPDVQRRRAGTSWGDDAPLQAVQWSPDGRRIATCNLAGQIIIRDDTYGRTIDQRPVPVR